MPAYSRTVALILLTLAVAVPLKASQQPFKTLEERMTGREFRDTGLYRLSEEELETLNQWLREHSLMPKEHHEDAKPSAVPDDAEPAAEQEEDPAPTEPVDPEPTEELDDDTAPTEPVDAEPPSEPADADPPTEPTDTAPAEQDAPEEPGDRRGLPEQADREPINSRIAGTFNGWHGNTEFELKNGMVWRQAERDTFAVREMDSPEVTIRPGMFGTWRLSVEGYSSAVRVERIR